MLIVFDDMIADLINNKKLNSIITELFIRRRKLSISLVFITKPFFKFPKDVRPNSTHFFILEIPNKRELQQIALNHSSGINSSFSVRSTIFLLLNHILFWLMMLSLHQIIL